MIVAGSRQQKTANSVSPRQAQAQVQNSPVVKGKGKATATNSSNFLGCCGATNDISMGSVISKSKNQPQTPQLHHQHRKQQEAISKLEHQVAELETEVQRQKELRITYRKRMERTQDYLRYCLQIAQDNGFLDLIFRNKDEQPDFPLSSSTNIITDTSAHLAAQAPQSPTPPHHHSYLSQVIDQAKTNGWCIDPQEIELQAKIGEGSTAVIYKAIWRGLDVAVKCIFPSFFSSNESAVAFFAQEVDTLSRQRHKFVLQLMGACLDPPNNAWVVTEFLSRTLKDWLHGPGIRQKERSIPVPPIEDRIVKALEIAQAMQYLHEQNPKVIHRDLKPSNIFLDDANHVRVADFGHARFLSDEEMALTGETGTYVYMAPEVVRCEPYNEKSDVYSFGIILNELITGDYPYIETKSGPSKIAMEVAEGNLRPTLPEDNGQLGELINLICLSWEQDASVRPSFATITASLRKIQETMIENVTRSDQI